MKLVYIAGPYRASTQWEVEQNIQNARREGAMVAKEGHYPVIPHANTAHMSGLAPEELFLEGSMALLKACDGVYLTGDWQESMGSVAEYKMALELGIPVSSQWEDLKIQMGIAPEMIELGGLLAELKKNVRWAIYEKIGIKNDVWQHLAMVPKRDLEVKIALEKAQRRGLLFELESAVLSAYQEPANRSAYKTTELE